MSSHKLLWRMVESPQEFSVQLGPNFGHRDRVVLTQIPCRKWSPNKLVFVFLRHFWGFSVCRCRKSRIETVFLRRWFGAVAVPLAGARGIWAFCGTFWWACRVFVVGTKTAPALSSVVWMIGGCILCDHDPGKMPVLVPFSVDCVRMPCASFEVTSKGKGGERDCDGF